jgi:DNA-binding phage protein
MPIDTRLESFIRARELKPAQIAREAGCSRKHLYRVRKGLTEPTRPVMRNIAHAVGSLLGRKVRVAQLFSLGDGDR